MGACLLHDSPSLILSVLSTTEALAKRTARDAHGPAMCVLLVLQITTSPPFRAARRLLSAQRFSSDHQGACGGQYPQTRHI